MQDPAVAKLSEGMYAEITRVFGPADVCAFVSLCGDDNPVHTDAAYAAHTQFKKPIVHGMLYGSLFGTIFGATITGAIYVSQNFAFKRPVFVGEPVTARVEVVKCSPARRGATLVTCKTTAVREDGTIALEGEAVVMLPPPQTTGGQASAEAQTLR